MDPSIPAPARLILEFIYRTETGRDAPACYRVVFGHRENRLARPITEMTLAELAAAQKDWGRKWGSSAAGAAQIIRKTLLALMKATGTPGTARFTPQLQDRFAYRLLRDRGLDDFLAGRKSRDAFALALAQEWASFPVPADCQGYKRKVKRGQSYYAGDGLNEALVAPAQVEALLDRVKALAKKQAADAREQPGAPEAPPTGPSAPTAPAEGKAPENSPEPTRKDAAKELTLSKRFWTWLTTGGGTALLPFVDWRVQIIIAVAIIAFAVYAIATMPQLRRLLGLPVKGALLAAAVLPFLSDDGRTHDAPAGWAYPLSCCSGYDCREVSASAIEEGPAGYVIKATGEIIPMQDPKIRTSPDGLFHWCSKQGRDDTPTICLFVPPRGA